MTTEPSAIDDGDGGSVESYDEVARAATIIGEDPDRLVGFAQRRLAGSGVTPSELASALLGLCRRGVRIEVPSRLHASAHSVVRASIRPESRSEKLPEEAEEDVG